MIVVNTSVMSVQLENAKSYSKRLRNLQIPHTLNGNVIKFASFGDMRVLLEKLKIKVERPPPPPPIMRVEPGETSTRKDSMSFWRGYTTGSLSHAPAQLPTRYPSEVLPTGNPSQVSQIQQPGTSYEYELVNTLHRGSQAIDQQTNAIRKLLKSPTWTQLPIRTSPPTLAAAAAR